MDKEYGPGGFILFTSIVVIFVFYRIPQSKRSVYLMPIYPFIAYFLAKYLFYLVKKQSKSHQGIRKYSCNNQPATVHLLHRIKMWTHPRNYFPGSSRAGQY